MAHHRDAQFLEVICISNAREHEQLWRIDGAPTQDHLLAGISLEEAGDLQSHFSRSQLTYCHYHKNVALGQGTMWKVCSQVLE